MRLVDGACELRQTTSRGQPLLSVGGCRLVAVRDLRPSESPLRVQMPCCSMYVTTLG